jgi:hypothetical protein
VPFFMSRKTGLFSIRRSAAVGGPNRACVHEHRQLDRYVDRQPENGTVVSLARARARSSESSNKLLSSGIMPSFFPHTHSRGGTTYPPRQLTPSLIIILRMRLTVISCPLFFPRAMELTAA